MLNFDEIKYQTRLAIDAIEERMHQLEQKETQISLLEKRMLAESAKCADRVSLNVGGTLFETQKSNLLRYDGTYFFAMLSSGVWLPDKTGAYFIDTSPKYFCYVLDHLRGDQVSVEDLSHAELARVRGQFDYFQVPCPDQLESLMLPARQTNISRGRQHRERWQMNRCP